MVNARPWSHLRKVSAAGSYILGLSGECDPHTWCAVSVFAPRRRGLLSEPLCVYMHFRQEHGPLQASTHECVKGRLLITELNTCILKKIFFFSITSCLYLGRSQLPVSHIWCHWYQTINIDSTQTSCRLGLWCSEQLLPARVVSAIRRQFTEKGGLYKGFEWPHFVDNQ